MVAEKRHVSSGHGQAFARGAHLGQPTLDPRPQLGDGQRGLALAGARGQRDLHAVMRSTATRTRRARSSGGSCNRAPRPPSLGVAKAATQPPSAMVVSQWPRIRTHPPAPRPKAGWSLAEPVG